MSRHRFEIIVTVDDEIMAEHPGDQTAPPNEVDDWDGRDIFRAHDLSLLDDADPIEVVSYEALPDA